MSKLGQDLGRLFEVGFNAGMLAYMEQNKFKHRFGDLYRQDLAQLSFPKMLRRLADNEGVINQQHRQIIEKWSLFFLQKAFLAGLNLFGEYIDSTGWSKPRRVQLEILYYQCCFADDNSMGTYSKGKNKQFKDVLSQFGEIEIDISKYKQKGEFLNADTLMLIRCGKELRILCLDYSIFAIKSIRDLQDVDNIEVLRNILLKEISYLKSKSVFTNLGLDTKNSGLNLSASLARYYTAFKKQDKESVKLIQAGSYVHSFLRFLHSEKILIDETAVISLLGYSDRGFATMTLSPENLDVLATCAQIYKQDPSDLEIQEARKDVLNFIKKNAAKSFHEGRDLIEKFAHISPDRITSILHKEKRRGSTVGDTLVGNRE